MICSQCDSELICRKKDYGGNFAPTLQWQNFDGSAHYKTTDGKNFSCNIPEEEETSQTRIPTEPPLTPGDSPPTSSTKEVFQMIVALQENLEAIKITVEKIFDMTQAIFRYTVDEQLKKK